MGRPSKATNVLKTEGKSHRTKAELAKREAEEKALLTGVKMREDADVKADPVAHKEYARVLKALKAVGKNDALYEASINDYCRLAAEIDRYTKLRKEIEGDENIAARKRFALVIDCDKRIERCRKQRRDIEKENGMTIASAARAIPKTVSKKPSELQSALASMRRNGAQMGTAEG